MPRSTKPQISFADWELLQQGIVLEPLLQNISDFLDDHEELIEPVRRDLQRGLKNPRTGRGGLTPQQVLRSLIVMRVKSWDYLSRWFRRQKKPPQYFEQAHAVSQMSGIPPEIGHDIYIVEKQRRRVWAVFNCPCERGHRLVVNLSRTRLPFWEVSVRKGRASFWPSLWMRGLCKSHFWIRGNRVYWVTEKDYDWPENQQYDDGPS
jgi:hypothetical protein